MRFASGLNFRTWAVGLRWNRINLTRIGSILRPEYARAVLPHLRVDLLLFCFSFTVFLPVKR